MPLRINNQTTHVIFDYGGTIIDLAKLIEEIIVENTLKFDRQSSKPVFAKLRDAESFDEICREVCNNFELKIEGHPNYKDLDMVKKNILKWIREKSIPMVSGAQKMIRHLYDNNIPIAFATNLDRPVFDTLLDRTIGFNEKYISHYVCGGTDPEVKTNKPVPDVYLVCAKRFSPPPKSIDSCLVFENSIKGITSAVDTGMKTVLVTDKTVRDLGGLADKTTRIITSFNNFCPESVGLPPFE